MEKSVSGVKKEKVLRGGKKGENVAHKKVKKKRRGF